MHDEACRCDIDRSELSKTVKLIDLNDGRIGHTQEHMSNPSVVQYQLWNEHWGEPTGPVVRQYTKEIMAADPSRLVDDATGGIDYQVRLTPRLHYSRGKC